MAGGHVLDYGCGDGAFLVMLMNSAQPPASAVGVEIDDRLVEDCRRRFHGVAGLEFNHARELENETFRARFDGLVCMEVLEHVVQPDALLDQFHSWLKPGGQLLISVPVETGPPVLVKQTARRIAGWCGLGDYPGTTPYTWSELCRSVFAGAAQHIVRPVHRNADGFESHDHKGFNWRVIEAKIAERFALERTCASPFLWLTPHLGSQAWFVARKHP
ncbi:MAG: class I SAM-dependent methyltransferase [Verrucomicrobiota bacterium]